MHRLVGGFKFRNLFLFFSKATVAFLLVFLVSVLWCLRLAVFEILLLFFNNCIYSFLIDW